MNFGLSELSQEGTTTFEAKKGVPDWLFPLGECNNGIFPSSSQSASECLWFVTSWAKEKQYTCLITLLNLVKAWKNV